MNININDIKNAIYTLLNSGAPSVKRYCCKEYKDCVNDIREIANELNTNALIIKVSIILRRILRRNKVANEKK